MLMVITPIQSRNMQMEVDELAARYPEEKLWRAVIAATIYEYENWLRKARDKWIESAGRPISYGYFNEIKNIEMEVKNPWFQTVCFHGDIEHCWILRAFKELETKYLFKQIGFTFTEVATVVRSEAGGKRKTYQKYA